MSKPNVRKLLTIEEVVSIKNHLKNGDLKGKEIALKFGIAASQVSNIKKGAIYGNIKLDENGNYIDDKMNDEHFQKILRKYENRVKGEKFGDLHAVDVKYILQKGYLTNNEIANDIFKIDPRNVRNILNGVTYAHVRIDENGKHMPLTLFRDEPWEEYIVPRIERVEVVEEVIEVAELSVEEQEILDIKHVFLERLWTLKPISIRNGKGNYVSTRVECSNPEFNSWLHNQWSKKYKAWKKMSLQDFIQQSALLIQEALMRFNPTQNFNWKGMHIVDTESEGNIADGIEADLSSLNIIFSYLKEAIEKGMIEYNLLMQNRKMFDSKVKVDGKEERYYEYFGIGDISTDQELSNDEGEISSLLNLLDNDASFFGSSYGKIEDDEVESVAHFIKFFQAWKRYFLTEEEYHIWEITNATQHVRGGGNYTVNDRHLYGLDKNKAKNTRRTIKAKAIAAYKEMYPAKVAEDAEDIEVKSRTAIKRQNDIAVLEGCLEIIEDEEIENADLNQQLSKYILDRLGSQFMHDMIHDSLRGKDLFNINDGLKNGLIASVTLYKLIPIIEEKLERLKEWKTNIVEFNRKPEEYVMDGKVIEIDTYREIQKGRHVADKNAGKRKKHTSFMMTTSGKAIELVAGKFRV